MYGFETRAVHVGKESLQDLNKPIASSIIYTANEPNQSPTLQKLESCIASLECAKYALCYPSGLAAVTSVRHILGNGDHAVVFDTCYQGTRSYLNICEDNGNLTATFADLRNAKDLEKHMTEKTRMVWIETPCNPTLKIVDISAVAEIVKKRKDTFLVVDNTFMSPYFQNPLCLGADIVMHSMTKYMNGHGDVMMGCAATNNKTLYDKLKGTRDGIGTIPSPMDCFLGNRGLKTLPIRMQRHMENAQRIAEYLEKHPKVEKVFYPGLKSHPQYEIAQKQCRGFSGMVAFRIRGGTTEASKFVQNLRIFTLAVSLGALESLIEIPSLMTACELTKAQHEELEITDNLIRMSVGLENVKDLISDLEQSFNKI